MGLIRDFQQRANTSIVARRLRDCSLLLLLLDCTSEDRTEAFLWIGSFAKEIALPTQGFINITESLPDGNLELIEIVDIFSHIGKSIIIIFADAVDLG